jgi:NAD(P)-dependent dehydrogenase (short-subunit alcohol dehydrogenase family)
MTGEVLFITGAASGIGAAVAREAVGRGYRAVLADINEPAAKGLADELGPVAVAVGLDVRDPVGWESALDAAWDRFGRVDVLVNNAGIVRTGFVQQLDLAAHREMMDINYFGPITGMKAAIPRFAAQGHGQILNICSMTAFMPLTGYATYGATKHALRVFHHSLALEERDGPVSFTIVHPPAVQTPMLEQELADESAFLGFAERAISPSELAESIVDAIKTRPVELVFPTVMGRVQRAFGVFPRLMRVAIPIAERTAKRHRARLLIDRPESVNEHSSVSRVPRSRRYGPRPAR